VRSCSDVGHDHLPTYALMNSRTVYPILIKFGVCGFFQKSSNHFGFHLGGKILITGSRKSTDTSKCLQKKVA
jgi:hypothetical protein